MISSYSKKYFARARPQLNQILILRPEWPINLAVMELLACCLDICFVRGLFWQINDIVFGSTDVTWEKKRRSLKIRKLHAARRLFGTFFKGIEIGNHKIYGISTRAYAIFEKMFHLQQVRARHAALFMSRSLDGNKPFCRGSIGPQKYLLFIAILIRTFLHTSPSGIFLLPRFSSNSSSSQNKSRENSFSSPLN